MNTLIQKAPAPCVVHSFCTNQGVRILENAQVDFKNYNLNKLLNVMTQGNAWCDEGYKSIHHFYHPKTEKGIMGLAGANVLIEDYIEKAYNAFNYSTIENCFFNLGSALHLIQDLCVPHHALGHLLRGHMEYEDWVATHYLEFRVFDGGKFDYTNPMDIFRDNALAAIEYKELIENPNEKNMVEATKELLGLAQRSTASFLYLMLNRLS